MGKAESSLVRAMNPRCQARCFWLAAGCLAGLSWAAAQDAKSWGGAPFTEQMHTRAVQARDAAVGAAAYYNLLHLQARSTNEVAARAALETLAGSGDAFTLSWLAGTNQPASPRALQPLVEVTLDRIRARLRAAPEVPAQAAQAWMLRTAVSDCSCNELEVPLKRFGWAWLAEHGANPEVRRQIESLTNHIKPSLNPFDPAYLRARAASYRGPAKTGPSAAAGPSGQTKR